ncbi:MAG: DUF2807 domain-containing protein [Marinilabiliaceae bacterium]|nr:DUF2807 domain-containing protein [Marinilabiliaceae bacterium]
MKNTFIITLVAACLMSMTSCIYVNGNDNIGITVSDTTDFVTRSYDLADFNSIDCSGVTHITYKQADTYSLTARSTEKVLDNTDIEVRGNKLVISPKKSIKNMPPIFIELTTPELNDVDISGASTFKASRINTQNCFSLDISGVAHVEFDSIYCASSGIDISGASKIFGNIIATEDVDIDASGAVKSEMSIKSNNLKLDCGGAIKMDLNFVGDTADIECSGAGKIVLDTQCNLLKAENSGVSKLTVKGTAKKTKLRTSGVSSIDTEDLNND